MGRKENSEGLRANDEEPFDGGVALRGRLRVLIPSCSYSSSCECVRRQVTCADEMLKAGSAMPTADARSNAGIRNEDRFTSNQHQNLSFLNDGRPRSPARSVLGACLLPLAFPLAQHSAWLNFKNCRCFLWQRCRPAPRLRDIPLFLHSMIVKGQARRIGKRAVRGNRQLWSRSVSLADLHR